MSMSDQRIQSLPSGVQSALSTLVEALKQRLEQGLVSFMVFGSVARGGYEPGRSDVDAVVVLRDGLRDVLEKAAEPLVLARLSARIEAMILVESEIARAADVFPLFYDDIRSCHILLHGADPFQSLVIHDTHRRLRIEQELREISIRFRRAIVEARGDTGQLSALVKRKLKQLRSPLFALEQLLGEPPSSDTLGDVMRQAARRWDVPMDALANAHEAPGPAADALLHLLSRAIDVVDRWEVS